MAILTDDNLTEETLDQDTVLDQELGLDQEADQNIGKDDADFPFVEAEGIVTDASTLPEPDEIILVKDDNSALLEKVFQRILETSMSDVPICNDSLKVEAIAYGDFETEWLGVLVTPWCMNIMMLPGDESEDWDEIRTGLKFNHVLPAGRFEFITGKDDELGPYRMCSLFSPMFQFGDHNSAMQTAALSLRTLMDPSEGETVSEQEKEMNMLWRGEYPEGMLSEEGDAEELDEDGNVIAASQEESISEPKEPVELSRRDFLRGSKKQDVSLNGEEQSR